MCYKQTEIREISKVAGCSLQTLSRSSVGVVSPSLAPSSMRPMGYGAQHGSQPLWHHLRATTALCQRFGLLTASGVHDAEQSHGHHLQAARMRASSSLQRELLGREGSDGLRRIGLGREEKGCGSVLDALAQSVCIMHRGGGLLYPHYPWCRCCA